MRASNLHKETLKNSRKLSKSIIFSISHFSKRYYLMLSSCKRFLTFFFVTSIVLFSWPLSASEQPLTGQVWQKTITLEYPELNDSIASLESVYVLGSDTMTYCSLIARTNLQRFTWLPVTTSLGVSWAILQWDAIHLLEAWIETKTFLPIKRLEKDMKKYYSKIVPYSLFDMYIYTPSQKEYITQEEYLFQWHRVVILFVEWARRVMDPLRGSSQTRQSWDVYKQYLSPLSHVYIYNQTYTFARWYVSDFSKKYTGLEVFEVDNLAILLYKWVIVSELDESFMPVASMFLKTVTLFQQWVSLVLSEWLVVRSMDESPFNIWLLSSSFSVKNDATWSVSITLWGKDSLFSLPVWVALDIPALFPEESRDAREYIIQTDHMVSWSTLWCNDFFDEQWKKITIAEDERLFFTLCRTWTYTVTPILVVDK